MTAAGGAPRTIESRGSRARAALEAARRDPQLAIAWGLCFYCAVVVVLRLAPSALPYAAETDLKQWVWQYHRYATEGAFAPGHAINDYVFRTQPPAYWLAMASLSTFIPPAAAAFVLNAVAFIGALFAMRWVVAQRTSPLFGALAAALLARDDLFHKFTCGGYPRSFGPVLVLLFLGAWLAGKHRVVLTLFVVMAALYPSIVVPCGLAYGAWSVVSHAWAPGWLRRNLELGVAGAVVIVLAELQSLIALPWWGGVVSLAEAESMPALGPDGRWPWLPFPPFWEKTASYVLQPFGQSGLAQFWGLYPWSQRIVAAAFACVLIACVAIATIARVRGRPADPTHAPRVVPWQPLLLIATATLSFFVARALAFQLYLPHRMVQHVVPYATLVLFVTSSFAAANALIRDARAARRAALALGLSVFVFAGDGLNAPGVRRYTADAPLYRFLRESTPIDAQIAGTLTVLDEIPLFSARQMYVNWKMAHPIRRGYSAEMERRIVAMMNAYYANDASAVIEFARSEDIDYFVVDRRQFATLDASLFEPIRTRVSALRAERGARPFVLEHPPADSVVFAHGDYSVVDLSRFGR